MKKRNLESLKKWVMNELFRNIIIGLSVVALTGCGGRPDASSAKKSGAKGVAEGEVPMISVLHHEIDALWR